MKSQISSLKETLNSSGKNAEHILSLTTVYALNSKNVLNSMNKIVESPKKKPPVPVTITTLQPTSQQADSIQTSIQWLQILYENKNYNQVIDYLENMKFNFTDYLNDAKSGVENCKLLCLTNKWSTNGIDFYQSPPNLSKEIGIDTEEYILNLFTNISLYNQEEDDEEEKKEPKQEISELAETSAVRNSTIQPQENETLITSPVSRTATSDNMDDIEIYLDKFANTYFMDDNLLEVESKNSSQKEAKKKYKYLKSSLKQRDFYVLSFDNEISSSSSSSDESLTSDDEVDDVLNRKKAIITETVREEEEDMDEDEGVEEEDEEGEVSVVEKTIGDEHEQDEIYLKNRELIISYYFSTPQAIENYLNSNLNSFVQSLENLNLISFKKSEPIDQICSEIIKIYSNICENKPFLTNSFDNNISNSLLINDDEDKSLPEEDENMKLVSFKTLISEQFTESNSTLTNSANAAADIGPFLKAIFTRLEQMLNNSLQINVLLTGLIARLCYYPQPILRSYLLDHNLVLESNVKSLIQVGSYKVTSCYLLIPIDFFQVLNSVKAKIDSCSQTYNNFTLLYLQAEICLIKRLIDPKNSLNDSFSNIKSISNDATVPTPTPNVNSNNNNKKSFGDKILDLFRRPSKTNETSTNDLFPQIFNDFSK